MSKKFNNNEVSIFEAMNKKSQEFSRLIATLKPSDDINECCVRIVFETGEICILTSNVKYHAELTSKLCATNTRLPTIKNLENFPSKGFYLVNNEPEISKGMGNTVLNTLAKYDMHHILTHLSLFKSQRGNAILLTSISAYESRQKIYSYYVNHHIELQAFIEKLSNSLDEFIHDLYFIAPTEKEKKLTNIAFDRLLSAETTNTNNKVTIQLSKREKEVIYWYIKGKSAQQTGEILGISSGTVRTYFERLKAKLNCYYKPQIILKLIDNGLIKSSDWESFL